MIHHYPYRDQREAKRHDESYAAGTFRHRVARPLGRLPIAAFMSEGARHARRFRNAKTIVPW